MALYDSADLLAKLKALLQRPSVDEDATDPMLYLFLGDAQVYWMGQLAAHVPELNYAAPELMSTSDGGLTYTTATEPLGGHMEIRSSRNGVLLRPGPEWDDNADYTQEGQIIRIPGGRTRSFGTAGPYARYVKLPGALDGSNAPVMKPTFCRLLLVPRAAIIYSTRGGGYRDTSPFEAYEQRLWSGSPSNAGDSGFLGVLKTQTFGAGMAAVNQGTNEWWRGSPDLRNF